MSKVEPAEFTGKAQLEAAGFECYKICTCGGVLTYKYRLSNTRRQVWIYPRLQRFKILNDSREVGGGKLHALHTSIPT